MIFKKNEASPLTEQGGLESLQNNLIDHLTIAIYICNSDGYIVKFNKSATVLWEKEPELGKVLWCGFNKSYNLDGTPLQQADFPMAIALKEERIVQSEIIIERQDGEKRNILHHPQLLYDSNGKLSGAINTLIDITEQVKEKEKIKENEISLRFAVEAAEIGCFDLDLKNKKFSHSNPLIKIFGYRDNQIVSHEELIAKLHPDDKSIREKAVLESYSKGLLNYEARVIWDDKSIHWIKVYGKTIFDEKSEAIRMYGTIADITEPKFTEVELEQKVNARTVQLREQNEFVQTLLDSLVDSVMVIDINEVIISLNAKAKALFSPYFPESIVGKTLVEIDPATKSKPDWQYTSAALNGEYIHRKAIKSETEERYFDIYYIPLKLNNETYAIMLLIREVTEAILASTEIEKANKSLIERNGFIEAIIENSHEWIVVYDKELTLITINKACEEMLGINKENLLGKKLGEIFPSVIGTKSETDLLQALKGASIQNEIFYSSATGKYLKNYITPLKDAKGNVYAALAIANDMTEFKLSEEKIKKSNTLFSEAQRLSNIGSWEWEVLKNEISWSDEMYNIFGVSKETYKNDFENYFNCIYSYDRTLVSETIQNSMQTHNPYSFHHRIALQDGTIRTLHSKGEVFLNSKNEVVRLSGTAQDITKSIELENKLKQSEMRHHLMTAQIEDYAIIYLSPEGNIEDWNRGAQKIKGYTQSEAIGLHYSIFYTEEDRTNKVPDNILKQAKENKTSIIEGWRVRKDGSKFWASIVITALTDENNHLLGFSKLTRDLTEQKRVEEEINKHTQKITQQNILLELINKDLSNQKAFAELLIESSPLMIFAIDKDMLISTWNKKCEDHNTLKKEDVLGKNTSNFIHEFNNEAWLKATKEVLAFGKTLHYPKVKFTLQTGWGEVFVTPLRDIQNQVIGVLFIIKEITQLIKITSDLENKNFELEKSNKELASFSYIASHDLQEPLRKISTFTSRIQEKYKDQLSEEVQLYIGKIENSSKRMTTLILDLLNYSRLTDHERIFTKTDLNNTLHNVLNDFELLIEQKSAKINIGNLPVIEAVPIQMNQLFYNLISNALKFSKEDNTVVINISARKLQTNDIENISLPDNFKKTGDYIELIFEDNGIGFDQKYAEQIFEIFQRLHSKTEFIGNGIGLGLSKKIVENHNGVIFCKSIQNEGSSFHIILPVKHII